MLAETSKADQRHIFLPFSVVVFFGSTKLLLHFDSRLFEIRSRIQAVENEYGRKIPRQGEMPDLSLLIHRKLKFLHRLPLTRIRGAFALTFRAKQAQNG
jgi:hypothetical protein